MKDYIKEVKTWLYKNDIPFQIVYETFEVGANTISPQIKTENGIYLYFPDKDAEELLTRDNEIMFSQFAHNNRRCKAIMVFSQSLVEEFTTKLTRVDVEERFEIKL